MMRYSAAVEGEIEEEEEEEEDEEEFHESLDRILSSCSSASASDDDLDRRRRHSSSSLPSLSSLDIWTSVPAPVAERRVLLLQRLGLAGDPSLDRFDGSPLESAAFGMIRSASDGSAESSSVSKPDSDPIRRPCRHNNQRSINLPVSHMPTGHHEVSEGDGSSCGGDGEELGCSIKNLDNGRELVVKGFGKDGMGNKLKEVGTGRQLTMDEFENWAGRSPIVQELMRRQNVEEAASGRAPSGDVVPKEVNRPKKKGGWLTSIRNVAGAALGGGDLKDRRSRSTDVWQSSDTGARRLSSSTDDNQARTRGLDPRVKVRQHGKSHKELTGLYLSQATQAHNGSIWSIKFSLDGRYLASAGEDRVIHVWEVFEISAKDGFLLKASEKNETLNPFALAISSYPTDPGLGLVSGEANHREKKRRAKMPGNQRSVSSDPLIMPEQVFSLSEKPVCSFRGHLDDILDLSWSRSQYLLSSSMDKTVRLWHLSSVSCLKTFTHSDYVTCIQFNPIDDRYFISGSLDEKFRIWSIPDRQIVDWNDLHEMVTAACYTPDGQGALVGSHNGSCHLYDTSGNKLLQKCRIDLQNNKKKSRHKKITGFQFAPGSSSKVLVTSADSRVRVIDNNELVHKFKGFRNTSSQISAHWAANGKYVICASEDSHVYLWGCDEDSRSRKCKTVESVTETYEYFRCQGVTVAVPWPGSRTGELVRNLSNKQNELIGDSYILPPVYPRNARLITNQTPFNDKVSATWPEELMVDKQTPQSNGLLFGRQSPTQSRSAWGLVTVAASRSGEIRIFQNFGTPFQM
ncbi:WD repeat-containing protein 44-like [Zingiber officinale]|uniref:WD repeat-containing protein 44-like n=1 Tax=Zingiber officinale TaxID=94328 RepID=UPI001C4B3ADD|nr:WD repeat-containing protein 44-like [Zingiber officinale]